ncbi:MAG: thiol-disulfide oxidoreductase DCC family protein [Rhodopirellula sp. JB044]|uniref:thiol-disulfide oxidoreductase DCC family protein n=1 Tax=Rhodopirellula sp. JB044 TaxID=3342844 RepID=UPI00370BF447
MSTQTAPQPPTSSHAADLPDPDVKPGRDVVIFDGQCNACGLAAKRLHQLDRFGDRLSFISLHDPRVVQWYPNLTHDDLMEQMYVVDTEGRQHGGADALRYLSRRLPILWAFAPLLHIPGTAGLSHWLYGIVARNRYWVSRRFFGTKDVCDSDACSIHFRK